MSDMKKLLESMTEFSTEEIYETIIELDEDSITDKDQNVPESQVNEDIAGESAEK